MEIRKRKIPVFPIFTETETVFRKHGGTKCKCFDILLSLIVPVWWVSFLKIQVPQNWTISIFPFQYVFFDNLMTKQSLIIFRESWFIFSFIHSYNLYVYLFKINSTMILIIIIQEAYYIFLKLFIKFILKSFHEIL